MRYREIAIIRSWLTYRKVADIFPARTLKYAMMCDSEVRVFVHMWVHRADMREQVLGRFFAWVLRSDYTECTEIKLLYVLEALLIFTIL